MSTKTRLRPQRTREARNDDTTLENDPLDEVETPGVIVADPSSGSPFPQA